MTDLKKRIAAQHAINNPPPAKTAGQIQMTERLAAVRAAHANPEWTAVEAILAGDPIRIEIAPVWGYQWQDLEAKHAPVHAEDRNTGYNRRTLPRDYPADRLKVDGAHLDQDTWRELYDVLDPSQRDDVSALMWGINVLEPVQMLQRLSQDSSEKRSEHNA